MYDVFYTDTFPKYYLVNAVYVWCLLYGYFSKILLRLCFKHCSPPLFSYL